MAVHPRQLLIALRHPKHRERLAALRRLKDLAEPAHIPEIIPLLDDTHRAVREEALWLLTGLGGPDVVAAITSRIDRAPAPELWNLQHALRRLDAGHDVRRRLALAALAPTGAPFQRRDALDRLKKLGDHPETRAALLACALRTGDALRWRALEQLQKWKVPTGGPIALPLLDDPDEAARLRGVALLGPDVAPEIVARMVEIVLESRQSQMEKSRLLALIRQPEPMMPWLEHGSLEVAARVAIRLGMLGHTPALPLIRRRLSEASGIGSSWTLLRADFVTALSHLEAATPDLKAALHDRGELVRSRAHRALKARGIPAKLPTEADLPTWPERAPDGGLDPALLPRLLDDDPDAWEAHAADLEAAGDPRAVLVRRQTAPVLHRDLSAADSRHVARYGFHRDLAKLCWHRGYWHRFGSWSRSHPDAHWHDVFSSPSARLLQDLSMRWIRPELLLRLLQTHAPPLRRLHWNERDEVVDFDPFFAALPDLRELRLWRPARFSAAPTGLHTLAINTGPCPGLSDDLVRFGATGAAQSLRTFELWGSRDSDWSWLSAFLDGLPLTRLTLSGSVPDVAVRQLVGWPGLRHLTHLSLQGGWPGETAMTALVEALEARTAPLAVYESTGWQPPEALQDRLSALAQRCSIRG